MAGGDEVKPMKNPNVIIIWLCLEQGQCKVSRGQRAEPGTSLPSFPSKGAPFKPRLSKRDREDLGTLSSLLQKQHATVFLYGMTISWK